MRTALITGHAGFVGFHLADRLLKEGWRVIGIDDLNPYYSVALKERRLEMLQASDALVSYIGPIQERGKLEKLFEEHQPDSVFHLAAQAGVRDSIDKPRNYFESNLQGTFELLEAARHVRPQHLLMASSSSVYGANSTFPSNETQSNQWPLSFYAATKKSTEIMAHSYAHIHGTPITMLRFFTVYGPWGRPDMAYMKFIEAALEDRQIDVYNEGKMKRDFTYIDDVVESLYRLAKVPPCVGAESGYSHDSLSPVAPHRIVNIGNSRPVELMTFIDAIETALGRPIKRNMHPMVQGDVEQTWADTGLLQHLIGFQPKFTAHEGVKRLVDWYLGEYVNR